MIPLRDKELCFGVVEDIHDPLRRNRVRVRVVGVHSESLEDIPTDKLPWAIVAAPTTVSYVSGMGSSPNGLLQGSMVVGIFIDDAYQDFLVLWSVGGNRQPFMNSGVGFNDPDGIYPAIGGSTDVSDWVGGVDIEYDPTEQDPINEPMEGEKKIKELPEVDGKYITLAMYFKGRDTAYPEQLTDEIIKNATETVKRVNVLLELFFKDNPNAKPRSVNSGWRPPAVNTATKGAAKRSTHLTGEGIDLWDRDSELDKWLYSAKGREAVEQLDLYVEHMAHTPTWAHVQTRPTRSGNRFFRI